MTLWVWLSNWQPKILLGWYKHLTHNLHNLLVVPKTHIPWREKLQIEFSPLLTKKIVAQIGYFGKLNSTLGSFAMFFLRTLHSFSCSWPTTNNGFRSDVLAGYSVKMFWQSIFWPDQNSETCPSMAATLPSRTWLLAGIRGNFLLFAVFEVRWPRPNIELGWPAPCRLGGGHFADLPFHRGELRSRRTENPDKRPQTKPTNTAIQSL